MRNHCAWIRVVAIAVIAFLSMRAMELPIPSSAFLTEAYAGERQGGCADCTNEKRSEGTLCALKYLILFFWYASMLIAFVVAVVMDIATGFSQDFTKSFIGWFEHSDAELKKFFRKHGC